MFITALPILSNITITMVLFIWLFIIEVWTKSPLKTIMVCHWSQLRSGVKFFTTNVDMNVWLCPGDEFGTMSKVYGMRYFGFPSLSLNANICLHKGSKDSIVYIDSEDKNKNNPYVRRILWWISTHGKTTCHFLYYVRYQWRHRLHMRSLSKVRCHTHGYGWRFIVGIGSFITSLDSPSSHL